MCYETLQLLFNTGVEDIFKPYGAAVAYSVYFPYQPKYFGCLVPIGLLLARFTILFPLWKNVGRLGVEYRILW